MHGTGLSFNLLFYFVFSFLYFFVVSCKIKSDVRRKSSFDTFLINSLNSTKHIFFTLSIHFFTSINCFTRILPKFCRNKNAFDAKPDKKCLVCVWPSRANPEIASTYRDIIQIFFLIKIFSWLKFFQQDS